MEKLRVSVLMVALFAGLTLLTACEKAPSSAPASQAEAPTPVVVEPSDAAPSGNDAAAAPDQPAAEPQAAASLPAECESYLVQVTECINKLNNNIASADALKEQMEQVRSAWAQTDQAALGTVCKQAAEAFAPYAKEKGC